MDNTPALTLDELIERLQAMRKDLAHLQPMNVVVWRDDEIVPVTDLDYDRFEEDGPWVVEIRKAGDP